MKARSALLVVLAFFGLAAAALAASRFDRVKPFEFDPERTFLVQAEWLTGIGCPTNARVRLFNPSPPFELLPPSTFTDTGCPTGDSRDRRNTGLLLAKTGPTLNNAAAGAELKNVKGITLTELGYDLRKAPFGGVDDSHCGAGAPRFNVTTEANTTHFIGCASPPPTIASTGPGWSRLRWTPAQAFPPIPPGAKVKQILIIFDEGQDAAGGPDSFGLAVLDNIDVNGTLVGQGSDGDDRGDDHEKGDRGDDN